VLVLIRLPCDFVIEGMLAVVSFVGGVLCSIQGRFCKDITVNWE
jgi:hypothetical protein